MRMPVFAGVVEQPSSSLKTPEPFPHRDMTEQRGRPTRRGQGLPSHQLSRFRISRRPSRLHQYIQPRISPIHHSLPENSQRGDSLLLPSLVSLQYSFSSNSSHLIS